MSEHNEVVAVLLDAENIAANAAANIERALLAVSAPGGFTIDALIGEGRRCIDFQVGMLAQWTDIGDSEMQAYWRTAIAAAMVSRFREMSPFIAFSGDVQ